MKASNHEFVVGHALWRRVMRFKDKVAIVTGGAAGMGRSTALGFVNEAAFITGQTMAVDGGITMV